MQQILKRKHLVTQRNMGCFQGLAIFIVVCTVIICVLQTLYFFLLKRTKNVPSSRINCEDLNGNNREPGNPRKINIQWPHLNGRKQPIEHSEQPFNQVQASWPLHGLNNCYFINFVFLFRVYGLICTRVGCSENMGTRSDIFYSKSMSRQILKLKVYVNLCN